MMAQQAYAHQKILSQLLVGVDMPDAISSIVVTGLSIDSRKVQSGFVFVASQGVHTHGQKYIVQAIERGAVAVFAAANDDQYKIIFPEKNTVSVPVIYIPNMEAQLSQIAGIFFDHPTQKLSLIGVTGTNGKTSCTQLLAQLSALADRAVGVVGTTGYGVCRLSDTDSTVEVFNENDNLYEAKVELPLTLTGMTTPDALTTQAICEDLFVNGSHSIAMEVSSHGLVQHRVAALFFDVALFTNLTHDHLDYHGDMAAYGEAKSLLFTMPTLKSVVINIDDDYADTLIQKINTHVNIVTYSIKNNKADIYLSSIVESSTVTSAVLHIGSEQYAINTSLVGRFNLSNLLAVVSAFYGAPQELGVAIDRIVALLPLLHSASGRMESIANKCDRQVVVDYAHTPDALKNVLQALQLFKQSSSKNAQVWCVFGCGGNRDNAKRPLMASIAEQFSDHIIVTNDNPRHESSESIVTDIVKGFSHNNYRVIFDREQAIIAAIEGSKPGDIILIAGKGHEDYQLINDQRIYFSDQVVARLALRNMEVSQ